MSETPDSTGGAPLGKDEMMTALFAQMVLQMSSLAMMLMGQAPHPETGKTVKDHQSAKVIIDQLEMLDAKTKGNLTSEEEALLTNTLTQLRLTFVQTKDSSDSGSTAPSATQAPATGEAPPAKESEEKKPEESSVNAEPDASKTDESKVRYSKKY